MATAMMKYKLFSAIINRFHHGFPTSSSKSTREILFATLEQAKYLPAELNETWVTANSATLSTVNNVYARQLKSEEKESTAKVSMWNILTAISLLATAIILLEWETSILVTPLIRDGNFLVISRHPFSMFNMYTPKYADLVVRSFIAERSFVGEINCKQRYEIDVFEGWKVAVFDATTDNSLKTFLFCNRTLLESRNGIISRVLEVIYAIYHQPIQSS